MAARGHEFRKIPTAPHRNQPGPIRVIRAMETHPQIKGATFIGHADAFWANVSADYQNEAPYPTGPIKRGGVTDKLLGDHPNLFGDLSANSGNNAMSRDPAFTADFLKRHQDKLMFGSDCTDKLGEGEKCLGAQILAAVRRLAPDTKIQSKIFHQNAMRVIKVKF